jgi:hypothetical protein
MMLQSWLLEAAYLVIGLSVLALFCWAVKSARKIPDEDESSLRTGVACPACGNPMEAGYVAGSEGVEWRSSLKRFSRGHHIFGQKYRVTYSYFAAHLCRQCGIIKYNPPVSSSSEVRPSDFGGE